MSESEAKAPLAEFYINAGVVIHIQGIPVYLGDRTRILTSPENWSLIRPDRPAPEEPQ